MDARSLVNDARVLLARLQSSQWRELHARTPQGEIYIARPGAGPNPMRSVGLRGELQVADGHVVRSPHVGTVLESLPRGMLVEHGAVVCRLGLLGEVVEVRSPRAGAVGEVLVVTGMLVEYETPLITIVAMQ